MPSNQTRKRREVSRRSSQREVGQGGLRALCARIRATHPATRENTAAVYFHLAMRRGRKIAKVAMARKLAVQLFWMMRKEWDYEVRRSGPHAGQPEHRRGVQ